MLCVFTFAVRCLQVIELRERFKWLENQLNYDLSEIDSQLWIEVGHKKRTLDDETNFCDPQILKDVLTCKVRMEHDSNYFIFSSYCFTTYLGRRQNYIDRSTNAKVILFILFLTRRRWLVNVFHISVLHKNA